MNTRIRTAAALLAALCLSPLAAGAAPAILDKGVPAWSPESSSLSIDLRGRLLYDIADFGADAALSVPEGKAEGWRAQRIGADIRYGDTKITAEFEFAGSADIEPTDLILTQSLGEGFSITLGHFKEAASMQEQTSSLHSTFMERAAITDAFSLSRRVGVGADLTGETWSVSTALQGGTMDGLDVQSDGWSASARASIAPVLDQDAGRVVHFGASIRYRDHGDGGDPLLRYRQRPNASLAPYLVGTDRFARSDLWLGVEAAAVAGPLHVSGEYARLSADGAAGGPDATLHGAFIEAGWMLTRETRPYDVGSGRFGRVTPRTPLGADGFGAWELAVRWDWIDLQDGPVAGGEQTTRSLGVNWRPTARTRLTANYVDADIDGGPLGGGDAEIVQGRFQIDW